MFPIQQVLVPTDFSAPSEAAFQLACSLARDHGGRVVVLHVYPRPLSHGEVVARRQEDGYEDDLWRMLHQLRPAGGEVPVEHRLAEGDAAEEIVRLAGELNCDLIVMGTHGRTGLARLLFGSVAEKVLRQAPCPVLTVKAVAAAQPQEAAPAEAGSQAAIWGLGGP
jgi:nucleotide-binding universal stress UspA family protein